MTAPDEIPALERAAYQRAARTILRSPLILEVYPDAEALPLVRRWGGRLRQDLSTLFDYRLELTPTTARLIRVRDQLDASQPALAGVNSDRPFDRRRYAYLALAMAVLGRAGNQIALSELAERVAAEADRIDGLELSPERPADRAGFVDAATWLEARGAVRLADGNARRWADDPTAGEALYDIDREVLRALYRPSRVLQHITSVTSLLDRPQGVSRDTRRREATMRVRRALVERPVVYYSELPPGDRGTLGQPGTANEVAALTGMTVERRAEGVGLIDVSGGFSDRRFPAGGTVAQLALLLANRIADRVLDLDAAPLTEVTPPEAASVQLVAALDLSMPRRNLIADFTPEPNPVPASPTDADDDLDQSESGVVRFALLEDGWLRSTLTELLDTYGGTFAAGWLTDPERLLGASLDLLVDLAMVTRVPGGVLALPLLARYRDAVLSIRRRPIPAGLFDL
jgi:uncharacterized protein (TIGR02678 family)